MLPAIIIKFPFRRHQWIVERQESKRQHDHSNTQYWAIQTYWWLRLICELCFHVFYTVFYVMHSSRKAATCNKSFIISFILVHEYSVSLSSESCVRFSCDTTCVFNSTTTLISCTSCMTCLYVDVILVSRRRILPHNMQFSRTGMQSCELILLTI